MTKKYFMYLPIYLSCCMVMFSCSGDRNVNGLKELGGLQVPEGFEIEEAVSSDLISYPYFACYDDKGNLFVFESTETNDMGTEVMLEQPSYQIRRLYDQDGDGVFEESMIYADRLPFPMGGTYYNGSLYITASPDLIQLTDTDGDGKADQRKVLLSGWKLNQNGAILSGPFMGRDGWLYMADARRGFDITTKEGEQLQGKGARIWRCKPDGSSLEWVSGGGFDNTIEIVFMPTGETLGTMTYFTDPKDGQRDAIMHWVEGGVYPKFHPTLEEDNLPRTGPLMPVMTKMARVAPSGLMRYESGNWGTEFYGNLFSAEFNTGRIMRYKLEANGATYQTEDESFITASAMDIHPTDVLEDGDGSLLVIVTGGWFIEGCPLSRVAKPEVKGGIYRVRKSGTSHVNRKKSWGNEINLSNLNLQELGSLLKDQRFKVRELAMDEMIHRGNSAIPILKQLLESEDPKLNTSIVFGLYRIGSEAALSTVRNALKSKIMEVRVAAARCVGLARDEQSIATLSQLVIDGELPVRRQAATALGQIGNEQAVNSLLDALEKNTDRMTEHALRYALINIAPKQILQNALVSESGAIRRTALLVLDQISDYTLNENDILPFLSSTEPMDRELGIWIASRHDEWADTIERYLKNTYVKNNDEKGEDLQSLLLAFASNDGVQKLIGNELRNSNNTEDQVFLLKIMREVEVSDFPAVWAQALKSLLKNVNDELKYEILGLIESRGINGFENELSGIVDNNQNSDELRIKALSAKLMTKESLSKSEWDFLRELMGGDHSSTLRQGAVELMSRADLNEEELKELAKEELPHTELLLLPKLLSVFEGTTEESVGLALIEGLEKVVDGLDNISLGDLEKVLSGYSDEVRIKATPLVEKIKAKQSERLSNLEKISAGLVDGDVGEGRKLFYGKAICYTCHAVGGEGADFGPDLSNIGEIRSSHDILEAIVYPSASFAREYDTYMVKTNDKTYVGIIVEETGETLTMKLGPGSEIRLSQSEILSIEEHTVSLMPPGIDQQLTSEELSDLMAFLKALPYRIDRLIEMNVSE